MLKDNTQVNINCSKLARQYGCDRRTVSKAINAVKNNLPQPKVNKPRKTDGFELIIEEKLKTGAPAIAICNYITKHHIRLEYPLCYLHQIYSAVMLATQNPHI